MKHQGSHGMKPAPISIWLAPGLGKLTASALALNLIGFTTTMRPSPPSHATTLEPFSRAISGLILTATLSASRSLGRLPPEEKREDSNRDNSLLLLQRVRVCDKDERQTMQRAATAAQPAQLGLRGRGAGVQLCIKAPQHSCGLTTTTSE